MKYFRCSSMEMKKVRDIACGHGFTIFGVNDNKAHLFGTGLNKDGQIGKTNLTHNNSAFVFRHIP